MLIDELSYQEKEILFVFTELYYRLKPRNSIILYDEPGTYLENETYARITTLLREVGDNNQIWITSYPSRTIDCGCNEVFRIEDHLGN
jgi:energy-coupling factor transporter ATP-binding protein EcfA2